MPRFKCEDCGNTKSFNLMEDGVYSCLKCGGLDINEEPMTCPNCGRTEVFCQLCGKTYTNAHGKREWCDCDGGEEFIEHDLRGTLECECGCFICGGGTYVGTLDETILLDYYGNDVHGENRPFVYIMTRAEAVRLVMMGMVREWGKEWLWETVRDYDLGDKIDNSAEAIQFLGLVQLGKDSESELEEALKEHHFLTEKDRLIIKPGGLTLVDMRENLLCEMEG